MKSLLKISFVLLLLLITTHKTNAQPEWDDDPIDTPIDGSIGILIASGLSFGVYAARKARSNNSNNFLDNIS